MNFTKFTDESKYLINDSQNKTIESSNQQIMPEHLLKVMFDKKTEVFNEITTTIGTNFILVVASTLLDTYFSVFQTSSIRY